MVVISNKIINDIDSYSQSRLISNSRPIAPLPNSQPLYRMLAEMGLFLKLLLFLSLVFLNVCVYVRERQRETERGRERDRGSVH